LSATVGGSTSGCGCRFVSGRPNCDEGGLTALSATVGGSTSGGAFSTHATK